MSWAYNILYGDTVPPSSEFRACLKQRHNYQPPSLYRNIQLLKAYGATSGDKRLTVFQYCLTAICLILNPGTLLVKQIVLTKHYYTYGSSLSLLDIEDSTGYTSMAWVLAVFWLSMIGRLLWVCVPPMAPWLDPRPDCFWSYPAHRRFGRINAYLVRPTLFATVYMLIPVYVLLHVRATYQGWLTLQWLLVFCQQSEMFLSVTSMSLNPSPIKTWVREELSKWLAHATSYLSLITFLAYFNAGQWILELGDC